MAFDFFGLCDSYQNAPRMNKATRDRRSLIIGQLPDDYSARTKKTQTKVRWALDEAGIKVNIHTFRADLSLIQSTYQFLSGSEQRRNTLLQQAAKNFPNASAIRYFENCGLDTWEKVLAAKDKHATPAVHAVPVPEPVDPLAMFLRSAQAMVDETRNLRAATQAATAENLSMRSRIEMLEGRIGALDLGQIESFLDLARQLQQSSPASTPKPTPPAPPASNFPEGPQESQAFGKPVEYTDQFARNAKQLDRTARNELFRVLGILLANGVRDRQIKCGSRPGNPPGLLNAKLFKMFIIWQDTPKKVQIHWIESGGKPLCK